MWEKGWKYNIKYHILFEVKVAAKKPESEFLYKSVFKQNQGRIMSQTKSWMENS